MRLSRSNFYIEYGAGGTTILASRLQKRLISVETDAFFLKAVRTKIERDIGSLSGRLMYANVGVTEEWAPP